MIAIPITLTVLTVLAFLVLLICIAGEMGSPIPNDANVAWPGVAFLALLLATIGAWVWL